MKERLNPKNFTERTGAYSDGIKVSIGDKEGCDVEIEVIAIK